MSLTVRSETIDGGFPRDIFDGALNGMPGIDMYRAWVWPDAYPKERQPVLKNWDPEDLEAYCGEYTTARRWQLEIEHYGFGPRYPGDVYPYEEGPFADPSN